MVQVRQEYSSDLHHLAAMRRLVREACEAAWGTGADADAICQLELAVDEAASNIMLHAYCREQGRPIELLAEADAGQVTVTLYHCGHDFDAAEVAPPAFDASREHGFGVYLIQKLVDQVTYLRSEQGRCGIRLVKKRA
jgi:anti-sigma regulatory factor (Ser/Thr protein kinase)